VRDREYDNVYLSIVLKLLSTMNVIQSVYQQREGGMIGLAAAVHARGSKINK
jgi:hypothetical protein